MKYSKGLYQILIYSIVTFVKTGAFTWDEHLVINENTRRTNSHLCTHEAQHEFILLMTTDNKPTKTTLEVFFERNGVFNLDNPRISNTYTSVVTNDKTARCLVKRLCFMLVIDDVGGDGAGSYQAYWNGEKHCMRR